MQSAATQLEDVVTPKRRLTRRRGNLRLVDDKGNKIPEAVLIETSERFRTHASQNRVASRLPDTPERRSVAQAMLMVEVRLVKAFWTIARQPLGVVAPLDARRNGLDYIHDRTDIHARYADAAGGKWDAPAPRPSLPSSKEIDDANEALDWLLLIEDEALRRILVVGATSKRGEIKRRIPWPRIRPNLGGMSQSPQRTLQWRYREALRIIVSELTLASVALQG